MLEENKAVVRRWLEECDSNLDSGIDSLPSDYVWHGPAGQMGPEAFRQLAIAFYSFRLQPHN